MSHTVSWSITNPEGLKQPLSAPVLQQTPERSEALCLSGRSKMWSVVICVRHLSLSFVFLVYYMCLWSDESAQNLVDCINDRWGSRSFDIAEQDNSIPVWWVADTVLEIIIEKDPFSLLPVILQLSDIDEWCSVRLQAQVITQNTLEHPDMRSNVSPSRHDWEDRQLYLWNPLY